MPDYIIKRLQRLLNAAARIITNLGKYDHITDAMKKLHWTHPDMYQGNKIVDVSKLPEVE